MKFPRPGCMTIMNIWRLNKHKHIKRLLLALQDQLGEQHYRIVNEEYDDYFSVELVKPAEAEIRAYVYMYGQSHSHYGIHLEYPWLGDSSMDDVYQDYEDLSLNRIISILACHFDVPADSDSYGTAGVR